MLKLGLIGDLAETGFGRVSRELAKRWLEAGHDMRIIGINFHGREGEVKRALDKGGDGQALAEAYDRVANDPVLSRAVPANFNGDGMGHDLTAPLIDGRLAKNWKPDHVVFIADPVASLHRQATDGGSLSTVPSWNYVPIEGMDLSVFWRTIYEHVEPVAMSRFGQRELNILLGRDDVPCIPHGISDAFYHIDQEHPAWTDDGEKIASKDEAKAHFGWTGRKVILRTDRFVPRKAYPEYFEVIRNVISDRPEVLFVIHCATIDEGGVMAEMLANLPGAYADKQGWKHEQVVLTRAHDTFRGLSDERLNILYNAADIYASTAYSEGFGLTLAESAAVGTPVVANDFGAIPEAVGLGALLVPPASTVPTGHGHWWASVDIDRFSDTLIDLIDDPALRLDLGTKGQAHVKRFDWDKAALDFLALMENPKEA